MAEGFITRRGGVADATPPPTIKFVSKTEDSVTFTITNNSIKARDITYGLTTPPTTTTINLAGGATSSNQTISNITQAFITIFAQAEDSAITEFRVRLGFPTIYTAATGGTTLEYNSGGKRFKSHTFTSNGNFVVSTVGDNVDDRNKVDYLIIAGGGSSGGVGGGGGAGGFRSTIAPTPSNVTPNAKVTVTAATFGVTIGAGGAAISGRATNGNKGSNSQVAFATTIIAEGGGASSGSSGDRNGFNGGSGGGGGASSTFTTTGGLGTSGQGRNGGNGPFPTNAFPTGGGGGAGAVGQTPPNNSTAGNGGNGLANTLRTGSNETRAGGGGAGLFDNVGTRGFGGTGGGGNGGRPDTNPTAGTVNTGGGGGGLDLDKTSATVGGGSGIVIIRYEIAPSV